MAFSWMGVGSLKPMSSSALKNCLLSFSASKPMRPKVLPNVSCGMPKAEVNHTGFEDMAPLKGEEAAKALVSLRDGTNWVRQLGKVLSQEQAQGLLAAWNHVDDVEGFQLNVVKPFLEALADKTTSGFTWSGELSSLKSGLLFLTNHKDIVLDPSFLNVVLLGQGLPATEIGIGSNLLASPWVNALVRLNRCFVVERSGSARDRYQHSLRTAAYIRHITAQGQPVWLAHREGRAKDGVDATAPALIRTLSDNGHLETWDALRVSPVSLSYEWDPCDGMKVRELLMRERDGDYTKAEGEDQRSMLLGMVGDKGRVHFHFNNAVMWEDPTEGLRPEQHMAAKVDEVLMTGMRFWPNQRLCGEWLGLDPEVLAPAPEPTQADREAWKIRLSSISGQLEAEGWSEEQVSRKWCEITSAPLTHRHALLHK